VPIVLGRDVSLADTAAADHPVVIGSDLARALWGDANPIGRVLASPSLPGWNQDSISMTVIGVYDATRRLPGRTWNAGTARRLARGAPAHARDRHSHRGGPASRAGGADVPRVRVRVSLVALALGLPLSVAALRIGLSQGMVIAPQVNPYLIGVVIALVLLAVASAATWLPARRAALVDPARTLRVE
jgi:hypothetical protein